MGNLVDCVFVGTPVASARNFGKSLVTGRELHIGHEVVPSRRENLEAPTAYQPGKTLDWSDVAQVATRLSGHPSPPVTVQRKNKE